MPVILRILLGLATIGVGMGLVIKSRVAFGVIGPIRWAEDKLGPGQTDTFIKIIGIIIIFIGIIRIVFIFCVIAAYKKNSKYK